MMRLPDLRVISILMTTFLSSCSEDEFSSKGPEQEIGNIVVEITDGLYDDWTDADEISLLYEGNNISTRLITSGDIKYLPMSINYTASDDSPLIGVYPAANVRSSDNGSVTVSVPSAQVPCDKGYDPAATVAVAKTSTNILTFNTVTGGLRFNFNMSGITRIELESVDGYALAGTAIVDWDSNGLPIVETIKNPDSIVGLISTEESGFVPGKDYYISTLPCNIYAGYRLSIYRDGLVAHYFGVHQIIQRDYYISPTDLMESELEFKDPDEPLVEEERPELDAVTSALLRQYKQTPTDECKSALLAQMGIRYDKVVARKKAKLRELEREAKTPDVIEEMQIIVNEMVENREIRLEQQFLRLIDPRTDEDPDDSWMVLRGASAPNAYIAYTPVTNSEYALFKTDYTYDNSKSDYPVVDIPISDAMAYCEWLATKDPDHIFRLPTDEEWILGAGHMPKDVIMNAGNTQPGLTPVDAYWQASGACGAIDFWGNCWEWTSSTDAAGLYIIKGGSWNTDRDDCRSEKSDIVRAGSQGYYDVGFRVVRTDLH